MSFPYLNFLELRTFLKSWHHRTLFMLNIVVSYFLILGPKQWRHGFNHKLQNTFVESCQNLEIKKTETYLNPNESNIFCKQIDHLFITSDCWRIRVESLYFRKINYLTRFGSWCFPEIIFWNLWGFQRTPPRNTQVQTKWENWDSRCAQSPPNMFPAAPRCFQVLPNAASNSRFWQKLPALMLPDAPKGVVLFIPPPRIKETEVIRGGGIGKLGFQVCPKPTKLASNRPQMLPGAPRCSRWFRFLAETACLDAARCYQMLCARSCPHIVPDGPRYCQMLAAATNMGWRKVFTRITLFYLRNHYIGAGHHIWDYSWNTPLLCHVM